MRIYTPVVRWTLRRNTQVIAAAIALVFLAIPMLWTRGSEFMPQVDEGSLLYMPSTMPGIPIAESQKLLQLTDQNLMSLPEVDHPLGKVGRTHTSADPGPLLFRHIPLGLKPE